MKKAFSLVEILIVVAILGILAAIVMPQFQNHSTLAKEAAAKDNIRILRNAIELYTSQHNDIPPGYLSGNTAADPIINFFFVQLTEPTNESGQDGSGMMGQPDSQVFPFGPYISDFPENPFTDNTQYPVWMLGNSQQVPDEANGQTAWIYHAATRTIKLNWPGTDSQGIPYYDY